MIAGGTEYTIYFAWVAPGTPWDVSLARFDENIFDLVIDHEEGQIPTAIIEVINPRIGFISPSRLYYAWISYSYDECGPLPLFFGRLIGIPEEIEQNTVQMKMIARDEDYILQKQQVARSLKVAPNYMVEWFDVAKRDDPDAILEGWSAFYHVDRISGRVSASDLLVGEDGTINFAPKDVFYDSVKCKILQSPLVSVNVKAEVQWEQQHRGYFYVGQWAWPTLGSDAFVGDWPKSGSSLGGGWFSGVSWAGERDPSIEQEALLTLKPQQVSISYSWQNLEKEHETGDTMSVSINYTAPFGEYFILREVDQMGWVDPFALDFNGDPAPINIPAKQTIDYFCYRTFALDFLGKQSLATLGLVYQANRKRSERLEMTVKADVQPVLTDPLVIEDTEQITLKSGDLSLPMINMLNWDSIGPGGAVAPPTIIFPDNPRVPGQTSSQICVQAGNVGTEQPIFSNIAGQVTVDGSVHWASLGDTPPTDGAQDWVKLARVPIGTLLLPKPISGVPDFTSAQVPGSLNYPPTGTAVPIYSLFSSGTGGPGDTMYECTQSGLLGGIGQGEHAVFKTFKNPTGMFMYIAMQGGTTGEFHTTFDETEGSQTTDGSVIWQNLGKVELPIGGWPGMTPASAYFPTDRGQLSVQHMMCRARAKLRKRARAVEVSFETRFEVAAQLSCRMNGRVTDIRLPGGMVSGKVIGYRIEAHGDSGILKGIVRLGCSTGRTPVGHEERSLTDPGVPSYVQEGYVERGYQQYYSSAVSPTEMILAQQGVAFPDAPTPPDWPEIPPTIPPDTCAPLDSVWSPGPIDLPGDEIGYTPPMAETIDDGITFPPSFNDVLLKQAWHGVPSTINQLNLEIYNLQLKQIIHDAIAQVEATKYLNFSVPGIGAVNETITMPVSPFYDIEVAVQIAVMQKMLQGTNLWYELVLKPLTNGPFTGAYVITSTDLLIPQTIDLSAPSLGGIMHG